jgi:16S rRNA (guanine527-N7)-methyltransferase
VSAALGTTDSEPLTLSGLAERHGLDDSAIQKLACLQARLAEDPTAPISAGKPQRILADHLADSLVALELPGVSAARHAVDIGSGAGLPGLPLAIALPEARFALLESASRKCAFIEGVVEACGLMNVEVVHARAETWGAGLGEFDVGLSRAVASLEVSLEYAAPLLRRGGLFIAWRGRRDFQAEARAERAARVLGLTPGEVRQVWPYPAARDRYLHLFSKVMSTPERFPRRPGMAAKRPLGAG